MSVVDSGNLLALNVISKFSLILSIGVHHIKYMAAENMFDQTGHMFGVCNAGQ